MTKLEQLIGDLRELGYDVKIEHFRLLEPGDRFWPAYKIDAHPKGGRTVAKIVQYDQASRHTTILAEGVADCSDLDNYNRRLGALIAVGRAAKTLRGAPRGMFGSAVACSVCDAQAGEPCTAYNGRPLAGYHLNRRETTNDSKEDDHAS